MKIGKRTIYADQIVLLVCLAVILLGAGVTYDNIKFKDNTISSINTNGDIIFDPDGTGSVIAEANSFTMVKPGSSYRVAMNATTDGYIIIRNDSAASNVVIRSNGNTYFNGGNVGIGPDTTPDYLLDVQGTLGVDGDVTIGANGHTGYPLTVESGSNSDIDGLRVTRAGTPSQYMMIGTYVTGTIAFTGGVNKDMVIKNNSTTSGDILFQTNGSNSYGTVRYDGQFRSGSGSPAADRDTAAEAQLWVDGIAWADDGYALGGNGSTSYGKIMQTEGTFTDAYTTVASIAMGANNSGGEQDTRSFLVMISLADGPNEDGETELLLITYQDEGGSETIAFSLISETGTDAFSTQAIFSGGNVLIQAKNDTASQDGTANVVFIMGSVFDN